MLIQIGVKGQSRNIPSIHFLSPLSQLSLGEGGVHPEQFIAGPTERDKDKQPSTVNIPSLGSGFFLVMVGEWLGLRRVNMKGQNQGETSVQMNPPPLDSAEHSSLPITPSIEAQEGGELP